MAEEPWEHSPVPDMGAPDFEQLVKTNFPEFFDLVAATGVLDPVEMTFGPSATCLRCGLEVVLVDVHQAWHRRLTLGTHLNAWMAGRAHDAMNALASVLEPHPETVTGPA